MVTSRFSLVSLGEEPPCHLNTFLPGAAGQSVTKGLGWVTTCQAPHRTAQALAWEGVQTGPGTQQWEEGKEENRTGTCHPAQTATASSLQGATARTE